MSEVNDNMFIAANKNKYRFATSAGSLTVEDLWDLPLVSKGRAVSLDTLAKDLYKVLNENEVSFVDEKSSADTATQRKLEIVKYVIEDKKAVQERVKKAQETKARNQKIMELIDKKKDEGLEQLSVEELQKLLDKGS